MSIFKSTFKPFVVRQINARQSLLKQKERPVEFAKYVSAKSPWVRMTSFVDYNGSSDLAKKYVMMGGTLYDFNTGTGKVKMRAGLGGKGASYGGDLGTNQYGIRPMPGITSINVRNIAAYGSLSEATVRFYAWDVRQLEELSVLFMRPGYKVLLEWGWSMFLNTSIKDDNHTKRTDYKTLNTEYTNFTIDNTPFNTINCFDPNINQDQIYEQLGVLRHKYSANYDGVLGYIKNFNYTLQENGSYDCTTVLISMGDVIDSIKINDTTGINVNPNQSSTITPPATTAVGASTRAEDTIDYSEIKSQFELLFDEYCKLSDSNPRTNSPLIQGIDALIKPEHAKYIDRYIYKYNSGYSLAPNVYLSPQQQANNNFGSTGTFVNTLKGIYGNVSGSSTPTANTVVTASDSQAPVTPQPIPVSQDSPGDKRSYYYIQLSYLVHILNVFKTLYPEKGDSLIKIEIPSDPTDPTSLSNGLCQASFNSISIDPNVAMIRNSRANLFTDPAGNKGYRPEIFKTETQALSGPAIPDYNMREYLYANTNFGQIGNIYVNIKNLVSIYKSQIISNNGFVYLGEFLSKLLTGISFSLGSVNDFDKFVSDNRICLIDKHYTELPADSRVDSKFKINVAGNSSIVRKHKIESKIFPSQATMIAIAAQDRQNIASIQTSTYNYLNEGLVDRLFGDITNERGTASQDDIVNKKSMLNSILILIQYVNNYVMVNRSISAYYTSNIGAMNGYLNTLLVELEGGTDYKAVVPISADLEMDGLSGLTIGEIFTVDKRVLPKDYSDKSIGFIITNVSHEIITNSWITKIQSQMCILDQEEKQLKSLQKTQKIFGELYRQILENKADNFNSIRYYNLLAALVMDSIRAVYSILSGSIEVDKRKVSYLKSAITEYAAGTISYGDVLLDYENAYKKAYPAPTTPAPTPTPTPPPVITGPNTAASSQQITNPNPLIQFDVIVNSVKNMTYYNAMTPQIKAYFDTELNRVIKGMYAYPLKDGVGLFTWKTVDLMYEGIKSSVVAIFNGNLIFNGKANIGLNAPLLQPAVEYFTKAHLASTFFKIDINKAVDPNTGLLATPVPFVIGYPFYVD